MRPSDVLSGTGQRTVGWMGMYVIFASQNINPAFDMMFSAGGVVRCLERTW